ncbi:mediator of RNA polymerase II transcription subunit 27-like [Trifolium medium]|uniref:Mediator of RNA polymerase II transcription subunit 27-like n=1 Tax=Trifolium medium TaxID=97028 RepID=A0A392N608_9FABA|nr:mediator of RNA polymerase II transcription subunit 27-like [Trifolium medium]
MNVCNIIFKIFDRLELEEAAVLSESARSRKDVWGLNMPLVCPDGAVVAYAWKRQLAAQAGASATDRSRAGASVQSFLSPEWLGGTASLDLTGSATFTAGSQPVSFREPWVNVLPNLSDFVSDR